MKTEPFDVTMMRKYPDLFPKDENGNTCEPECGFGCPEQWENLVEGLMGYIDSCVKHPGQEQTYVWYYKLASKLHKCTVVPISKIVLRSLDPNEELHWKDGIRKEWIMCTRMLSDDLHKKHPVKSYFYLKASKFVGSISPKYRWKNRISTPVTIEQVKSKFSGLRFYYSGGNEKIRNAVDFAESLSRNWK